ncbi:MAG: nuclear transport factor 2 family protein [Pseudomonadota bacterium]
MASDPSSFTGLDPQAARAFAEAWLPAWTGGDATRLLAFYTEDAVYSDPGVPGGLQGQAALAAYFGGLLARNPRWVWTQRGAIPLAGGFLNLWHAVIPVGDKVIELDGVCTVQLRDGRIAANHVFFDRSPLLAALARQR